MKQNGPIVVVAAVVTVVVAGAVMFACSAVSIWSTLLLWMSKITIG